MVSSILVIVAIAVVKVFLLGNDDDHDAATNQLTDSEADAAQQAAEGDCMPEQYGSGPGEELIVPCDDPRAYWTITKIDDDAAVSVSEGDVTYLQDAFDICGEEVYARIPGEAWVDYNFFEVNGTTEQFFCLEAVQEPNTTGQIPKTPGVGACFDDLSWATVDCSDSAAEAEVIDAVPVSPPEELSESDAEALANQCSGGAYYWQVIDPLGRTGGVVCGNEL